MDIESLEVANQSLQVDLKLAFKRIGDLQAAIEDEMESDDNDDLINRYVFSSFSFLQLRPEARAQLSHLHSVNQTQAQLEPSLSLSSSISTATHLFF